MLTINKLTSASPVDYAAEELKKYLRMMMPEGGDIKIAYNPMAGCGFRLGLMQELGLDVSDAEDAELDDILYIDCDTEGGIIAGSNPRSVLLAVYEYLRQNGCRWLLPGVDGEHIPMQNIVPVKYRHKPSMRYRGWCNEGSEFQQCMIDAIDFLPKVGMNVFMMEFRNPVGYYQRYYEHLHNDMNRPPEPLSWDTGVQWKRACECEIARRGLQFHDIGHGWTGDPFGIDSTIQKVEGGGDNEDKVPPESRQYLAMLNGVRKLNDCTPNYTAFCMSNEEARGLFVNYVADYAASHSNSDYLHVWLSDGVNNQCECEMCQKKTTADWYVILLNELDEELTRRSLPTRVVFIAYADTVWAPVSERIRNTSRFSLLSAVMGRKYLFTTLENAPEVVCTPYVRNKNTIPSGLHNAIAYINKWREVWDGANIVYEYHFWRHQYFDVSGLTMASRINEDVKYYRTMGISGIIEDGSQRSFFPTGLPFYTYARTLYDTSLSAEEIAEDYLSCAFGEGAREVGDYLRELGDAITLKYMEGEYFSDENVSRYYNPEHAKSIRRVREITARGREIIKKYYNYDYRLGTVSIRLLEEHAYYADMLSDALAAKAVGDDASSDELYKKLKVEFGKREKYIERYYDHGLAFYSLPAIFNRRSKIGPILYFD